MFFTSSSCRLKEDFVLLVKKIIRILRKKCPFHRNKDIFCERKTGTDLCGNKCTLNVKLIGLLPYIVTHSSKNGSVILISSSRQYKLTLKNETTAQTLMYLFYRALH